MKQRLLLLALVPSLFLAACNTSQPAKPAADTTKPAVSLSASPASVSVGATVTLSATASDNVSVSSVKFYRGDTLLATDTTAPYEYALTTTVSDVGTLSFKAVASDAAGNTADASTTATVKAATPPDITKPSVTVKLTQLADRSYTVSAEASDNVGISKVEFYDNGTLIATSTTAPYNTALNYPVNATGTHEIVAKAYDAAGNVSESRTSFSVGQQQNTQLPVVIPSVTPNVITQSGKVTITALVNSSLGIAQVEFFLDDKQLKLTSTLPYTTSLDFSGAENGIYTVTIRATDKLGQVSEAKQQLVVAIDASEPNDTVATAKMIKIGDYLNGSIAGQARDKDYFKFEAKAGDKLKLTLKGSIFPNGTLDSYLNVYMPDGTTLLENNDDSGSGFDSEIFFNAPSDGSYIIEATSSKIHDDPKSSDDLPSNLYQLSLSRR